MPKGKGGFQKGNTLYKQYGFQKGHKRCLGKTWKVKDTSKMGASNRGKKDDKSNGWKGDNSKKAAMHHWIIRQKGKASEHLCIDCGKQASDWSNIDHSWKRILEDYSPRCVSCHRKFDFQYNYKYNNYTYNH